MPFGYVPTDILWRDVITRFLGQTSLIRRLQAPVIMKMLALRPDDRVLDAGCGKGFFAYEIARQCHMAVGTDLGLPSGLARAMRHQPNVRYIQSDILRLPFSSGKFDKILLSSVLQMVEDKPLLRECHRVLKPEGIIVLSVPLTYRYVTHLNRRQEILEQKFGVHAHGAGHYTCDGIIGLLRSEGFEILKVAYAPKKWGSLLFEIGLMLWDRLKFPLFSPLGFLILYPFAWFDMFSDERQQGNELIIQMARVAKF